MQSERPRETFAALFARGWRIYAASFSASIAPSLLCFALPAALVSAVAYFAAVFLFQPALLAVRELVQALLRSGLNTQAMEEALARAGEYLSAITPEGVLSMLLGMLGLLLVLIPLELLASVVLMPIGQGAVAEAQSRMWHGVRIPARRALSAAGRRAGRLIVLSLCGMAAAYAVSLVVNLALSLLAALPGGAGIVLIGVYAVQLALTLGIGACLSLAVLVGINEDKWHFLALYEAAKRFLRDGRFALLYLCYFGIALVVGVAALAADLYVALMLFFPPVFTSVAAAFLQPFGMALLTSAYYADRKRQGYAPACGLNDKPGPEAGPSGGDL